MRRLWAREEEGRITTLPPEPGVPVHTAWDLGHRHSTAIWFFQVRNPVLVPDHKVEDGINAAHLMFKRVWFDETKFAPGPAALRQHRVDYDEKTCSFKKTAKED
jgi:phage terminase large subunit